MSKSTSHTTNNIQIVESYRLVDPDSQSGWYSGVILRSTGMPHGVGRMAYDDGRSYEGNWCNGQWHGFGRATFDNGDTYEGNYRMDRRHGRGKYCWSDGRVYKGEFSEDMRHGKGTFKWPGGDKYIGDFRNGQIEGHGRSQFSHGAFYIGGWVDGKYEGFGEFYWEDGRTYKGEWRAGMAHGHGVETNADGTIRHDGVWIADQPLLIEADEPSPAITIGHDGVCIENQPILIDDKSDAILLAAQNQLSLPNPDRNVPREVLIRSLPSGISNRSYGDYPLMLQLDAERSSMGTCPELLMDSSSIDELKNDRHPSCRDVDDDSSDVNSVASSSYGNDRYNVVSHMLVDAHGDSGRYSGFVLRSTGMAHGLGRMMYDNNNITYDGNWCNGQWHGFGRATFANGDTYEGKYRMNRRHGRGKYCWSDGRVYVGEFSEDMRHGHGLFQWPGGAKYIGDFHNGQIEGHGRYLFSHGANYVGGWVDGKYEGFGEFYWEDGRTYKGAWRAGMAHGHGVETNADGSIRYDGVWIADQPLLIEEDEPTSLAITIRHDGVWTDDQPVWVEQDEPSPSICYHLPQ